MINLRRYALIFLEEKAQEMWAAFKRTVNFRNLISFLLKLDDDDLIDALETFLAKDQDVKDFFILIEEQVKLGMDTTRAVDLFIALIPIQHYSIETITQLVNIVAPNQKNIVSRKILKKLIASKKEKDLVGFIKQFPEYRSLLPIL